jgi:ATP-dependent DNA helicase RecQ
VNSDGFGTLVLTDASASVLSGERRVNLRREPIRAAKSRGSKASRTALADLTPEATATFEALRAWRGAEAKEQGVPAYVIFHDATLREIATSGPTTLEQLGTITGIGESKLEKYGEQLLATLRVIE